MPLSAASRIDFEAALNPDQLAAVVHDGGPQLVLAGAGSGKTRVITYRIAWLAQERGVDPRHIAAVTFTNKAAREMTARIERLLGGARVGFLGTFHRFSLRLLRIYGDRLELPPDFAIFDTADQKALIKQSILESGLDPHAFTVGTVLNTISHAKNRLINPSDFEREADSFSLRSQAKAYRRYQKLLREAGGVDFDDMIRFAVRLLREHASVRARVRERHRVLLVDEFQDTNHAQMALVDALAGERGALTAVGDEDQGIYRWRGAELDNILRFEDHFPGATVRKLEQNYRSTQVILDAAGAVVAHNEGRRGKRLWTDRRGGDALQLYQARDEQDEARWLTRALLALEIPRTELAVLVRTNAQTRAFEEALLERRVPYVMIGGLRFYERAEVKDLLAYLRLLRNPDDPLSFNRVLNKPPRGIGRTTHDALLHRALALDATPWSLIDDDRLGDLPKRARKALLGFRDLVRALRALAAEGPPLPKLLRAVIKATNYTDLYSKPTDENQAKLENINELLSAAQTFAEQRSADDAAGSDLLTAFLDHVSLVAEGDENRRDEPLPDEGAVSLMTMHSAKGLEFGAVAVAGLENGLLPHFNAQKDANDVEEERRLLYVA
ncbi:MAG: UvrD-helicase domain-containing protein, partial [Acidobacteriota bacterium]